MDFATCPYCQWDRCEAHFESHEFGGWQQVGPYGCDRCHASEIGPHNDERQLEPIEIHTGWYLPDPALFAHERIKETPAWRAMEARQAQQAEQQRVQATYGQW